MTPEEFLQYENERYLPQVSWYHNRAVRDRFWHRTLQLLSLGLTALTPALAFLELKWWTIGTAIALAVIQGIDRFFAFGDTWVTYRVTCEELKQERYRLMARLGEYGTANDPFAVFVKRVEDRIRLEGQQWMTLRRSRLDSSRRPQLQTDIAVPSHESPKGSI